MTREYDINIQPGHIARHTPRNAGAQGREAAVIDIAQDLLLRHLHDEGILDGVAIKGGTAIRKLYAGNVAWGPTHAKSEFDPERWLRPRGSKEFDMEDIGSLAVPIPKPEDLSNRVRIGFAFLAELDAREEQIARSDPRDRALAIRLLEELPGGRLAGGILY